VAAHEQLPSDLISAIAIAIREQVKTAHQRIAHAEDAAILKSMRVRWRESDKPSWAPSVSWLQHGEREHYERAVKKLKPAAGAAKPQGVRAAMPMMQVWGRGGKGTRSVLRA